ncbi:c-type cytochrome [Sphingomicrobium nitratireducens]|uniref:c-type cytochrome n=1 Tax=Sphingomicrobium nitratireducens TaxID=2964666 RepID=UPI00223EC511|nr:c-type cytochrome [Sphingomicrobium nitratireducens]
MKANAFLVVSLGCLMAAGAAAQNAGPKPYENVKVIPKSTPRAETTELMKHFTRALGVRCSYCHVGEEGAPLSTYDFGSDAKKEKRTARYMLKMVHGINARYFADEGTPSVTDMRRNEVTCYTCHRGSTEPLTDRPKD